MNIAKHLERSASFFPDRPAVRAEGREVSYRELRAGQSDGLCLEWIRRAAW